MANTHMNEQEQFLKGLEDDQNKKIDILDQPLGADGAAPAKEDALGATGASGATGSAEDDDDESDGIKPRNRRERRLVKKLQEERESSIFMAGKMAAVSDAKKAVTEESDYLKAIESLYGTATPEAILATDLLKKAIVGAREDAKREAIEEIRAERQREIQEQMAANQELDSIIEDLEDTYDVTLNEAHQKSFFQLLHKMSPKDRNGEVIGYADPHAVWEVFQEKISKNKGTDNRAKNLSARSMVQSGASKESTLQDDSQARFLRENGII